MSRKLPNLWIRENSLFDGAEGGGEGAAEGAMRRAGESPVRVLETNIDFPLSVNGDVNKGPNGNKRGSLHDHHHHHLHHDHHDAEAAAATDTMLSHHKYPLPNDDDDEEPRPPAGKLGKVASKHGLTKKGLTLLLMTLCLCFLLLLALLGMAAMWPRAQSEAKVDICLTPDCLRASAQVSPLLPSSFRRDGVRQRAGKRRRASARLAADGDQRTPPSREAQVAPLRAGSRKIGPFGARMGSAGRWRVEAGGGRRRERQRKREKGAARETNGKSER